MPAQSWESRAAAQSKALAAAGVVGNDSAAIAALLAGQSGRVQLALLDRADLDATEWRKVLECSTIIHRTGEYFFSIHARTITKLLPGQPI